MKNSGLLHSILASLPGLALAGLLAVVPTLQAQVAPSATGGNIHLWAGGEYSYFNPDWGLTNLPGIGVYADIGLYHRVGLEGEARFLNFTKPDGLTEKSYLVGPYAAVYRRRKLQVNAKFLGGAGFITYSPTPYIGYGSYFEWVPGGNVEYRIAPRLKLRGDYEYQFLPTAPGIPIPAGLAHAPTSGLKPHGFSVGVSYRVF